LNWTLRADENTYSVLARLAFNGPAEKEAAGVYKPVTLLNETSLSIVTKDVSDVAAPARLSGKTKIPHCPLALDETVYFNV